MNGGFSYRPPSADRGRRRLLIASILIVFLFLIDILTGGKLRSLLRGPAFAVSSAWDGVTSAIVHGGYFSTRSSLEAQIAALQTEVAQYQEEAGAYQALQSEYQSLSGMTHLAQTLPGVTAPIISSLSASPYGTFAIGAGDRDSVSSGDFVLSSDGFVIGDIASTDAHSALVNELLSAGRSVPVVIHGASVMLTGGGGENGGAQVPRGVPVAVGDPVVAPMYGGRAVGIVGNVASSSAGAYSDVIVALPVNLNVLRFVYVTPKE